MHLRLSWGTTRFVVLVGRVAIKVARPRPLWVLRRLLVYWVTGVANPRLLAYADDPLKSGFRHLFAGVVANWREYQLWRESPRSFLVPTVCSFWGIVNVQKRGEKIRKDDLAELHPFRALLLNLPADAIGDMTKAENFCHYEGRVCLVDYGDTETFTFFSCSEPRAAVLVTN